MPHLKKYFLYKYMYNTYIQIPSQYIYIYTLNTYKIHTIHVHVQSIYIHIPYLSIYNTYTYTIHSFCPMIFQKPSNITLPQQPKFTSPIPSTSNIQQQTPISRIFPSHLNHRHLKFSAILLS